MRYAGRNFFWHGSDRPITQFGGEGAPDTLHVGNLNQASMRNRRFLHLVEVKDVKNRNIRDKGSDNVRAISRARKAGIRTLTYLNRYEGISADSLESAIQKFPKMDFDDLSDPNFRKLFPEARSSMVILDLSAVKLVACYENTGAAIWGWTEQMSLGGYDAHRRPPAHELDFNQWIGKRDPKVMTESQFGKDEIRWIDECSDRILLASLKLDYDAPDIPGLRTYDVATEDGIIFTRTKSELIARDKDTGDLLGGVAGGVVYVEPAHRGKGVAIALHVCVEETRCIGLKPSHFSEGGFASRKAAHRHLCERALAKNKAVCQKNIEVYGFSLKSDNDEISL